jgi:hypothetical protein
MCGGLGSGRIFAFCVFFFLTFFLISFLVYMLFNFARWSVV